MKATSIHIKPVILDSSENHNFRLKDLDYVFQDLSKNNEHWTSDDKSLRQHFEDIKILVKQKTGRSLQKKATPIREGVIVIQENTKMSQIRAFSEEIYRKWGISTLQIHIHRDEGYMKQKNNIKLNLHAHIVLDFTNHQTGRSIKLNRYDMIEMQSILANCLNMQRGQSSDVKHLNAVQYKVQKSEETLEKLEEQLEKLKELNYNFEEEIIEKIKIADLIIENFGEKFHKLLGQCKRHYLKSKLGLLDAFLMWHGDKIEKDTDIYTADIDNGNLLYNGKVIDIIEEDKYKKV